MSWRCLPMPWLLAVALAVAVAHGPGASAWAQPASAPTPGASRPAPAASATARPPTPARDLDEQVRYLTVKAQDLAGRSSSVQIPVTYYRPRGEGPFPLAVVGHGRSGPNERRTMGRARFELLARYLVDKGFAVAVPTRVGYGETYGLFDPEDRGRCASMEFEPMASAAAEQLLATVAQARTLPWIDASRWLAVGQSVGGMAVLSLATRKPEGLVAVINFAGGAGGLPDRRPGDSCQPDRLATLWRERAGDAAGVPTLWLYWHNDLYWGAEAPRRWAQAWAEGGGKVDFHQLPAIGRDGHSGLSADMDHWVPLVESWLAPLRIGRSGELQRPPPSGYARVDEADKVPVPERVRDSLYQRFLAAPPPRAFAIGADGAAGWASGDWAIGRALGFCQRSRGAPCQLYAVDGDVVWVP